MQGAYGSPLACKACMHGRLAIACLRLPEKSAKPCLFLVIHRGNPPPDLNIASSTIAAPLLSILAILAAY